MSDKWLSGTSSESGILRKTKIERHTVSTEELLIFGYAAKLFRNDEQARLIDHGKHLIPWNGDNTLKIDRYDVRATLSDLQPYEAPTGGYTNRLDYLTPAEQRAEQLCEEERYRSLYDNDVDEELYREEESKRLLGNQSSSYGQVAFNYDGNNAIEQKDEPKEEEPDETFVPNPKFSIPDDVDIPPSIKLHAIIEKTAIFIASQGPQMEILVKAKQSNNPVFEFLNQNNRMNKYFKHILNAIKTNTYPMTDEKEVNDEKSNDANSVESSNNHSIPSVQYTPLPVPTLKYKPSADCSYTQLISKIKGVPLPLHESDSIASPNTIAETNSYDYSSYYSNTDNTNQISIDITRIKPPAIQPTTAILPTSQKLLLDLDHEKLKATIKSKAEGVEIKKISTGLMLAQCYNTDSESEEEGTNLKDKSPKIDFPIPHPDLQNIIDKTAAYVLKNGREFENILRTKNDARFSFLSPDDEYHRYYIYKVSGIIYPISTKPSTEIPSIPMPSTIQSAETVPKVITSVSFSIKPKDDSSIPLKPALPQEPSSDEDETNNVPSASVPFEPINRSLTLSSRLSLHDMINVNIPPPILLRVNGIEPPKLIEEKLVRSDQKIEMIPEVSDSSIRDAMLENNVSGDEKREARRAEDKFKDRLAQVAREKLGLISKEKQLQLERKKRAMAFLNQIKSTSNQPSKATCQLLASTLTTQSRMPSNNLTSTSLEKKSTKSSLPVVNNADSDASIQSIHSSPKSLQRDGSSKPNEKGEANVDDDVQEIPNSRSRSRSKSLSKRDKRKKSKHRSKKKSKRRASRSRSRSSSGRDRKHKKRSSSKKRRRKHRDD